MADLTLRLVKGTELTFGELDRNFGSLDSDIISLQSQVDSLAVAAGLDSARAINLITSTVDSAYVELMYSKIDIFRDSNFVESIVDSSYINLRVDLAALGAMDSDKTIALIDSALDSVGPFYTTIDHDSDTLVQVDSAYVRHRADSGYIMHIIDSDYIKFRADSDYIKSAADSQYVTRIAQDVAGLDSAKLIAFLDSESRHIIPLDGETYDLGTNLKRWRNIYVKDLFVSPATIHFSDSAETPQSTISLDSGGEFKLQSPTQTGFIATSTTGTAFDSNTILGIIDSAYVQSRALLDRFDDSSDIRSMIDSAYIQSRQIVGGSPWDSAKTTSIIDSAYIQARQVDLDTVRDSAFITGLVDERIDSTQFLATTATTTDVSEGDNLYYTTARHDSDTVAQVDSAYVQQRVRGPEMIAGGRFRTSAVFAQNGITQKQLFGIFDSGQAPGGQDGIDKISAGRYVLRFDSANLNRISSGDDYTVMLTYDYSGDDPTASSRTLTVMQQDDSAFQVILERSDAGTNEDYASGTAHINFQVWLY